LKIANQADGRVKIGDEMGDGCKESLQQLQELYQANCLCVELQEM